MEAFTYQASVANLNSSLVVKRDGFEISFSGFSDKMMEYALEYYKKIANFVKNENDYKKREF